MAAQNIGVDFDGVIADTNLMKSAWLKNHLGVNVPVWKANKTELTDELCNHFSPEQVQKLNEYLETFIYDGDYSINTPVVEGALNGLEMLAKKNGLYLVTARCEQLLPSAIEYLNAIGALPNFQGIYSSGVVNDQFQRKPTKQELCGMLNLDGLIDDDPVNLEGLDGSAVKRVLFADNAPALESKPEVLIARNWKEIVDYFSR